MILTLSLSKAEFASQRRAAQDRLVERLSGVVGAFLSTGAISDLKAALTSALRDEFAAESDRRLYVRQINAFLKRVEKALDKATPQSDVKSTALALSLTVLNEAAVLAASAESGDILLEWVTMHDGNVREPHREADGQQRPVGEKFEVGGVEMRAPGDMTAPIELWINCRCVLRPARADEEFAMKDSVRTELVAAASKEEGEWFAIMAIPATDDPVHEIGGEEKHATIVYFGEVSDAADIHDIAVWTNQLAADGQPFTAKVEGIEPLGHGDEDGQAHVWLLEDSDLNGIFEGAFGSNDVKRVYDAADITKYDEYTPHVTIGYDEQPPEAENITEIRFDRLAVWHGGAHTEFTLGEPMPDDIETDEPAEVDPKTPVEEIPDDADISTEAALPQIEDTRVPWHGVLAPEGVRSGDGRMFSNLGRTRDLPLPLTWQEVSADGHDQNITVATIEKVAMIDNLMHASGYFLTSVDEADETIGLISEFGKFGVSVDADDIGSATFDEDSETETYDDPRISSACVVSIPAFPEAYVALGPHPILDAPDYEADPIEPAEGIDLDEQIEDAEPLAAAALPLLKMAGVPESFKAAALAMHEAEVAAAADWSDILTAAKTEDGPGWLTHPVDTDRLRDYWVSGPGGAKIGWGVPGDFNRCRVNVAEYVKPQHLNGYCANRHYDALGIWPGREAAASIEITERLAKGESVPEGLVASAAPALTLVASAGWSAPAEFFAEPVDLDPDDGVRIDAPNEAGLMRASGYVAEWGVCHIGYDGMCKEAPPSVSNYAYFQTGEVNTPDGPVKVGALTSATGHANPRLAAMPAAAHYDNTGSVWAYVTVGENARGIWFSGMVKPGADEALLNDVVASGRISGDWRPIGSDLELVAGLTVNVPGFPIVNTRAAAANGRQLSLVAAGVPAPKAEEATTISISDPSSISLIASLVIDEMEAQRVRRAKMDELKTRVEN